MAFVNQSGGSGGGAAGPPGSPGEGFTVYPAGGPYVQSQPVLGGDKLYVATVGFTPTNLAADIASGKLATPIPGSGATLAAAPAGCLLYRLTATDGANEAGWYARSPAGQLLPIGGGASLPAHASGQNYAAGTLLFDSGVGYYAPAAYASGADLATDVANGDLVPLSSAGGDIEARTLASLDHTDAGSPDAVTINGQFAAKSAQGYVSASPTPPVAAASLAAIGDTWVQVDNVWHVRTVDGTGVLLRPSGQAGEGVTLPGASLVPGAYSWAVTDSGSPDYGVYQRLDDSSWLLVGAV